MEAKIFFITYSGQKYMFMNDNEDDTLQKLKTRISELLGVQKDFSLKLIRFNAEIVHPKFIPHEGELELILKEAEEEEKEESKKVSLEIPLDELREIKYLGKELLIELNKWTATKKFKMMYSEGEKILKSQYKRTMKCSEASCLFRLKKI